MKIVKPVSITLLVDSIPVCVMDTNKTTSDNIQRLINKIKLEQNKANNPRAKRWKGNKNKA